MYNSTANNLKSHYTYNNSLCGLMMLYQEKEKKAKIGNVGLILVDSLFWAKKCPVLPLNSLTLVLYSPHLLFYPIK